MDEHVDVVHHHPLAHGEAVNAAWRDALLLEFFLDAVPDGLEMGLGGSRDDHEEIGEMLLGDQDFNIEVAVYQLMIEKIIDLDDFGRAYPVMAFCVIQRHYFSEYGARFYAKLLAIQQYIREHGLNLLYEKVIPEIERELLERRYAA